MSVINARVYPDITLHKISKNLYGHFIEHLGKCVYGGIWVGEDSGIENISGIRKDTVDALKKIEIPVLRWPGGCFADNYHWMDGIGPRDQRPSRYNLWWHQPESNEFGTEEYMKFCELVGAEPYICLNVGSGSVEEARSWVEYCNSNQNTSIVNMRRKNGRLNSYNVKYWGIGNESWVCGGNMRPEYYADLYKQFATYIRNTSGEDSKLIACGSYPDFPEWDEIFLTSMKRAYHLVDCIALHIYAWNGNSDINFSDEDYYNLFENLSLIEKHLRRAINLSNAFSVSGHKIQVVFDEWGAWYKEATTESGLFQQNTMRDALYAAGCFHLFHRLGDGLFMTNIAQTINVLQSLIITKGDKIFCTPTYYVYDLFKNHKDSNYITSEIDLPDNLKTSKYEKLSISASKNNDGIFISVVNLSKEEDFDLKIDLFTRLNFTISDVKYICSEDIRDHNTIEEPNKIGIKEMILSDKSSTIKILPHSITTIKYKI